MTQPSFVNNSTQVTASGVTSPSVTLPPTRTNGNLLFAVAFSNTSSFTTPTVSGSGWSMVSAGANGVLAYAVAIRYVDGAEAAPTITFGSSGVVQSWCAQVKNTAPSNPIGANKSANFPSSYTSSVALTGITTTQANSLIVGIAAYGVFAISTNSPASFGFSYLANSATGPLSTGFISNTTFTSSGVATGNDTLTWDGTSTAVHGGIMLEVLAAGPTVSGSIGQTLPAMKQEIDVSSIGAGVAQTLPLLQQEMDIYDSRIAAINQTLALIAQSNNVIVGDPVDIVQILPGTLQDAIVVVETGILGIVQTLPMLQQEIDGSVGNSAHLAMTLPLLQQEMDIYDSPIAAINQTLALIAQSNNVIVGDPVDIVQILPGTLQDAIVVVETEILGIVQTLPMLQQEIDGSVGNSARLAMTLPKMVQEIDVTETEIGVIGMTLFNISIPLFNVYQTPPLIMDQTFFPLAIAADVTISDEVQIDMTFLPLYEPPDNVIIDMVLGGASADFTSSSRSRSGWWAGT